MKKWWIGAAVAAMCVGQSVRAQAPPGGGVLPDPVPVAPCPAPGGQNGLDFVPGPLTGGTAPPGPGDGLTLPADVPTAWGRGPVPEAAAYFSIGTQALMRERPGHGVIAEVNTTPVLTTHDVDPTYWWGGRVTFGYLCDDAAIEITGFYIPEQQAQAGITSPGKLVLPFTDTSGILPGPSGNSLLSNADTVGLTLRSALGNAELNYRWWSRSENSIEGIVGVRYMNLTERADITAGSVQSGAASGMSTGSLVAAYTARAENNLIMAQTGFEWNLPLRSWLALGLIAKGAVGGDFSTTSTGLSSGNGNGAPVSTHRNDWGFTSVYEVNAFLDLVQLEKVRLRFGYTALWLVDVAEGFQQVNFDLTGQPNRHNSGSVFYHGPLVELEFLF